MYSRGRCKMFNKLPHAFSRKLFQLFHALLCSYLWRTLARVGPMNYLYAVFITLMKWRFRSWFETGATLLTKIFLWDVLMTPRNEEKISASYWHNYIFPSWINRSRISGWVIFETILFYNYLLYRQKKKISCFVFISASSKL